MLYIWHDATLLTHPARVFGAVEQLQSHQLDRIGLLRLSGAQAACPDDKFLIWDLKKSLPGAIAALSQVISQAGSDGNRLWLDHPERVREMMRRFPLLEIGLLRDTADAAESRQYIRAAVDCGARSVSIHPEGLTPAVVRYAHIHDLRVYCYVREARDYAAVVGAGIDALISDDVNAATAL